jgi:hypothetical protein
MDVGVGLIVLRFPLSVERMYFDSQIPLSLPTDNMVCDFIENSLTTLHHLHVHHPSLLVSHLYCLPNQDRPLIGIAGIGTAFWTVKSTQLSYVCPCPSQYH